jgi:hypothetical protein
VSTAIDPAAVLKLPDAQKRAIFDALLADLGAHGVLQLDHPTGPEYIYRAPPNARALAEQSLRQATEAELIESIGLAENGDDDDFMSVGEVLRASGNNRSPCVGGR